MKLSSKVKSVFFLGALFMSFGLSYAQAFEPGLSCDNTTMLQCIIVDKDGNTGYSFGNLSTEVPD